MNLRAVFHVVGMLLMMVAVILLVPLAVGWFSPARLFPNEVGEVVAWAGAPHLRAGGQRSEAAAFLLSIMITGAAGGALFLVNRPAGPVTYGAREGFGIVTLGWVFFAGFGSLPFVLSGATGPLRDAGNLAESFTDAYFETMSGFTTTGASIMNADVEPLSAAVTGKFAGEGATAPPVAIEALPRGILLWRALTHWLGGMGVVMLALAVLPAMGAGGAALFRAEATGVPGSRLRPRVAETAKVLWEVYLGLTVMETAALFFAGMPLFDAFCHTFATLSSGGFSTKNASMGHYNDRPVIIWIVIFFMICAGTNFGLLFECFRGHFDRLFRDTEWRAFTGALLVATVLLTAWCMRDWRDAGPAAESFASSGGTPSAVAVKQVDGDNGVRRVQWRIVEGSAYDYSSPFFAFTHAAFQATSILSCTGFCTADFDLWPVPARAILVFFMVVGGCSGSTSGGVKVMRVVVLVKNTVRHIVLLLQPRAVLPVRVAGQSVPERVVGGVLAFFAVYMTVLALASLILAAIIPDRVGTAVTSVTTCMANVGPGLGYGGAGGVGASGNFDAIPIPGKWLLSFCMLAGRLELFSVLVLFMPLTWRKV
ncbi:MAG: TrkH family potassium uptake protein [Planctomycetes bacterium]|nr:TrkH family potassium uptake protein [Planctomycetota bacterium]